MAHGKSWRERAVESRRKIVLQKKPGRKLRIVPKLMNLGPGKRIPTRTDYVIDKKLGEGGVGAVYLAHNPKAPHWMPKAIKVISKNSPILDERGGRSELQKILEGEAEITAMIGSNPHVVGIEEFGETPDGSFYLIYPFIRGDTLHVLNRNHQKRGLLLPFELSAFVFHRVASILVQAHRHERVISHRDLSSTNVLLHKSTGTPMVLDWGSANEMYDGALVGNPAFIAPEVIGRPRQITKEGYCKADIFSLGAVIRELASGINPLAPEHFDTEHPFDYRKGLDVARLVPVHTICPDVPRALSDIIGLCMRPDPEDRPDADELYDVIGEDYLYTPQVGFGVTAETLAAYLSLFDGHFLPKEPLPDNSFGRQLRKLTMMKARRRAEREEFQNVSIKDTRLSDESTFTYGNVFRPFTEAYGVEVVKRALERPFLEFLEDEYRDRLAVSVPNSRVRRDYEREVREVEQASVMELTDVLRDEIKKDEGKTGEELDSKLNSEIFEHIRNHVRQYAEAAPVQQGSGS